MTTQNQGQPLLLVDRLKQVAEEQTVGGHFEGESKRERKVGHDQEVVVDIIKRGRTVNNVLAGTSGTYFMRVSLRCPMDPKIITRFEIDIERYSTERELLEQALAGGAAVAIAQIENRGARWDPDYVATQAREAMRELLHDISDPDKTRGA